MRHGAQKFMKNMHNHFQIAIAINRSYKKSKEIKEILDRFGINYDAIYSLKFRNNNSSFVFYDQIYKDFQIK